MNIPRAQTEDVGHRYKRATMIPTLAQALLSCGEKRLPG